MSAAPDTQHLTRRRVVAARFHLTRRRRSGPVHRYSLRKGVIRILIRLNAQCNNLTFQARSAAENQCGVSGVSFERIQVFYC